MNRRILVLLTGVVFLFFSCKKELINFKTRKHSDKFKVEQISFDYLTAKTKIKYIDGNRRVNGTAHIRMRMDSMIWISVSPMGIEASRCIITKDTILVINRMAKVFYAFNFEEISKFFNFNIDYDLVQAILLGNLALPIDDESKISKENKYFLIKQKTGKLDIQSFVNMLTKKIETVILDEVSTKNSMSLKYDNFKPLNEFLFAENCQMNITYTSQQGPVVTSLNLQHNKVEISDKPLKFPFNIPAKYESYK